MMRTGDGTRMTFVLVAVVLSTASPARAEISTIHDAVDGFIRPAYAAFADATRTEREALTRLCATPSKEALDESRQGFVAAVEAWGAVETIRIGPITKDNRLERVLYWPDRKSIGLKQVQAAIAGEDESAADPAKLPAKSVAMQGLGALEFVLFGTGSDDLLSAAKPYRCRFGAAIASNLATIASDVDAEWKASGGFADLWINPGPNNAIYRTEIEAANDFIETFVTGLELVRDVRIDGFLGGESDDDKPRQAIFWRSNATIPSLAANLDGLKRQFDASAMAARLKDDNAYIGRSIGFEFANAAKAMAGLDAPVAELLKTGPDRDKLVYLRIVTQSLSDLFGARLSGALGLSAGFSSLDGD